MRVKIYTIIIVLALGPGINGGCDVNDWPHSCLANFRIGKQRCEPCESGRYGCNCSESCPVNTYGPGCYTSCDCPEDEFCDPVEGCMNITHTTRQIQDGVKEATRQGPNNPANNISSSPQTKIDVKTFTTTTLGNDIYELSSFKIVGISIATSVPMVVISILVSILCSRRKVDPVALDKDLDAKSINAAVSETDEQNNDTHSYLTISDRSDRLYAAVHYDEAEDRKSSSPISLRSIKEHHCSESDNSKASESYLTPMVEAVEERQGDSQRSSDYEDATAFKM
uniref:Uncharacterized protein LOC111137848 n=1 Tax=Crassostrea virginica TaxID=6565 RepID=A0A8B8EYX2_CRAVI|nr:uncharacterized protein LOC111137848 [Crassostrea virginica]